MSITAIRSIYTHAKFEELSALLYSKVVQRLPMYKLQQCTDLQQCY